MCVAGIAAGVVDDGPADYKNNASVW